LLGATVISAGSSMECNRHLWTLREIRGFRFEGTCWLEQAGTSWNAGGIWTLQTQSTSRSIWALWRSPVIPQETATDMTVTRC